MREMNDLSQQVARLRDLLHEAGRQRDEAINKWLLDPLPELVRVLMRHHEMQRETMDGDCVGCQNLDHSTRPITQEDHALIPPAPRELTDEEVERLARAVLAESEEHARHADAAQDALALIDSLLARAQAAEAAFCEVHVPIPEEGKAECARCLAVHECERAEAAERELRQVYRDLRRIYSEGDEPLKAERDRLSARVKTLEEALRAAVESLDAEADKGGWGEEVISATTADALRSARALLASETKK